MATPRSPTYDATRSLYDHSFLRHHRYAQDTTLWEIPQFIPLGKVTLRYGKYAGKTISEVVRCNTGYIHWMQKNVLDLTDAEKELLVLALTYARDVLFRNV